MRKSSIGHSIQLIALALLCYGTSVFSTNYVWGAGGISVVSGPLIITPSDTLTINAGTVLLRGKIVIQTHSIINVNGDAVIKSDDAPHVGSLHFDTSNNNVNFKVNFNLEFQGADDGCTLLVTTENNNTTGFYIAGNKTVSFTRGSAHKAGGTRCFVLMEHSVLPTFLFTRLSDGDEDVTVRIGQRSTLGFISHDDLSITGAKGLIKFEPINAGNGRLILDIENRASVLVSPLKSMVSSLPEIDDVDFTLPGGGLATFEVSNEAAPITKSIITRQSNQDEHAGLLVLNHNNSLFDLLIDPFNTLGARDDKEDYNGLFDGVRLGFVLGNNGSLAIGDNTYLDYVGLTNNKCPDGKGNSVKLRNPSALIVDGSHDVNALLPSIDLGNCSGLFFRSGVDSDGIVSADYTVSPKKHTSGIGEIVFDVEGGLLISGLNISNDCKRSKLEILSLQVNQTGGSLFITPDHCPEIFPARTFATDSNGALRSYNTASWMINNEMLIFNSTIVHSDVNHKVFEADDVLSEPTYIGGETWKIAKLTVKKPAISFYNSSFFFHESIAFTGLDLNVPALIADDNNCISNTSKFVFFQNGKRCDNGSGRQMILGTEIGSKSCGDLPTLISQDVHLDVIPETVIECSSNDAVDSLLLLTAANNNSIIPPQQCILDPEEITQQPSMHTIFLGHNSNISIGQNGECDPLHTPHSNFIINGNFFSFESRGGELGKPECSAQSGQGGIFVDCNGSIIAGGVQPDQCFSSGLGAFLCRVLVNMGVMVTKSNNGVISLPKNRVFFNPNVGISEWHLDLSDPSQRVIVGEQDILSDYTLNWSTTKKDFDIFSPYQVTCYDPSNCPPVEEKNVSALPTVKGTVEQFNIKGSRLGDQATVLVDGGVIGEFIFLQDNKSAQASIGVVVLENDGTLGIGSTTLGVNGLTIIANGSGHVELNEDVIISNICHILRGPDFNKNGSGTDTLTFKSECCRTLRVQAGGVLDLSSFKAGDTVTFAGDIRLVLEPGARIILNGANLRFEDSAVILSDPAAKQNFFDEYINPNAGTLRSTDAVRVKLSGVGTLTLAGCSTFLIDKGSFVGVETCPECQIVQTHITINILESGRMVLGDDCLPEGGTFQIGNTENDPEGTVSFTMNIFGPNACFAIARQGFLGSGVGIVDKASQIPNNWLVQTTFNVDSIATNVFDGKFQHNLIFSGDNFQASLLALGGTIKNFAFNCFAVVDPNTTNVSPSSVLGGGNFVRINPVGPVNPTVLDDVVTSGEVLAGLFVSKPLLAPGVVTGNIDDIWNSLRVQDITNEDFPGRATAGPSYFRNFLWVGYVDQNKIGRAQGASIIGFGGTTTKQEQTLKIGAAFLILGSGLPPRPVIAVFELP